MTYTRLDDAKVSLPFCNVLTMQDNLVARYEIFIDPTPLMSAWPDSAAPSADSRQRIVFELLEVAGAPKLGSEHDARD